MAQKSVEIDFQTSKRFKMEGMVNKIIIMDRINLVIIEIIIIIIAIEVGEVDPPEVVAINQVDIEVETTTLHIVTIIQENKTKTIKIIKIIITIKIKDLERILME